MLKIVLLSSFYFFMAACYRDLAAQSSYTDSLSVYQQEYVTNHEVVKQDRKQLMKFYPVNENYRVACTFKLVRNGKWFTMNTSSGATQVYRKYGTLSFTIKDTPVILNVYQSQSLMTTEKYQDYLFIPFTDETTGISSYEGGRYLECRMGEIRNNKLVLDFNKAYNPYCAYAGGFSCPIPPRENHLKLWIEAGEMAFVEL